MKFYSSMRIDVRRIESIKSGDVTLGNRTRAKIVKNKVAPPFRQAEFDIMYGTGISREGDLLDSAVSSKVVDKSGSWYSFEGVRIGQGRENAKIFLKENQDIMSKIELLMSEAIKPSSDTPGVSAAQEREKAPGLSFFSGGLSVDEDGVVIERMPADGQE